MRVYRAIILSAAAVLPLSTVVTAQPLRYTLSFVDTSSSLTAYAMSPSGVVTGTFRANGGADACAWQNNSLTSFAASGQPSSWGYAVNDSGTVVGELYDDHHARPFIADAAGGLRPIDPFGRRYGIAYGINAAGTVVGGATIGDRDGPYMPFVWNSGGQALPLPFGASEGVACHITDNGLVSGTAGNTGSWRPVFWNATGVHELPLPTGMASGIARWITDNGWACGDASNDPLEGRTPILWHHGSATILPALGGPGNYLTAVNASGQCVGSSETPDYNNKAVTWIDGQILALEDLVIGTPNVRLFGAHGIDAQGRILAHGTVDGVLSAVVFLTPVPSPATAALIIGGVLLAGRRRPQPNPL